MNGKGGYVLGFLSGFVLGGAVGAVIALLLAPQSGDETREQLLERGIELRGRVDEVTSRARESAGQIYLRGRSLVDEQRETVRTAIEEGRQAAAQAREELTARFQKMRAGEAPEASPPPTEG